MPSKTMLLVMGKVWNGVQTKGFVHVDDDHCHGQESSTDSWREMGSKHQTPLSRPDVLLTYPNTLTPPHSGL